ncbi:MAG: alpha/beta hydrolase [bacterium]
MEEHYFIRDHDRSIYCVEYGPDEPYRADQAVLLCKPIWGERIRTHRIFTNLGRALARKGFHAVTCDYFGDGNSSGDALDLTFDGMVEDVLRLYASLERKAFLSPFSLIGLRLGATVALAAATRLPSPGKVILIEPVLDPIASLEEALRANLARQMVVHRKIVRNRSQLIEDIQSGMVVDVDGFSIGKRLWESYEKVAPAALMQSLRAPVTLISLVPKKGERGGECPIALNPNGRHLSLPQEFRWTDWKGYKPVPPILFDQLLALLSSDANTKEFVDAPRAMCFVPQP